MYIHLLLSFVERLSSFGGLESPETTGRSVAGPQFLSFVEKVAILCPYIGESTIRGSIVLQYTFMHRRTYVKTPFCTPFVMMLTTSAAYLGRCVDASL